MQNILNQALNYAKEARTRAYSPYCRFQVGAAVKAKGYDEIFYGCNIENASYGATICAERSAMSAMISKLGKVEIEFLLFVIDHKKLFTPCGICLQFMSEFATPDTPIHIANLKGIQMTYKLGELLNAPFKL